MISLILDCSCGMGVYLIKDNEVFSYADLNQAKHSDELLQVVDKLLIQSELKIKDVENIGICIGPGSFTGIRVAISLAKGLVVGTGAKIFTLTNFDIYDVIDKENSYLILDGFSSFVYARRFFNSSFEDICLDLNQLKKDLDINNSNVYVGLEKTQNLLNKYEINSKMVQNNIIDAFKTKIQCGESISLNQIFPVYLRASQAEIERENKLKNG